MNETNQQLKLIKEKKWWRKTNDEIKNKIIKLIEENSIFEKHFQTLVERSEGDDIGMISGLLIGKENIIVELTLISKLTNQEYTQEYVFNYKDSTIRGKCLIVIETKNKQRWIILQKIIKPWINKPIFGATTAFFPDFSKIDICTFSNKTNKGLSCLCANKKWQVKKIIDLGLSLPDTEFIANKIPVFVVEIISETEELQKDDSFLIEKEENIMGLVKKCNDALTLSILLKFKFDKDDN